MSRPLCPASSLSMGLYEGETMGVLRSQRKRQGSAIPVVVY